MGNYLTPYSALYEPTWSCQDWPQPFPLLKILTLYKLQVYSALYEPTWSCQDWPQPFPLLKILTLYKLQVYSVLYVWTYLFVQSDRNPSLCSQYQPEQIYQGYLGLETYSYILTKIITFYFFFL